MAKRCWISNITSYAIVFMDIEMPGIDGIETAIKIKEIKPTILIIYVTNYQAYISKAFRSQAFQFLVKPVTKEDLYLDLDRAMIEIKKSVEKIKINWNGVENHIVIFDIVYVESDNKKVIFNMRDGKVYLYTSKLTELSKKLDVFDFAMCHKSYLVNLRCVQRIENNHIILSNGNTVPTSKGYRQKFKSSYNLFLGSVELC